MIAGVVVGLVFMFGGALLRPRARPGEVRTTGTVCTSWTDSSLGEPAWLCTVEFRDTSGAVWQFQPPLSSARQRAVGTPVRVTYSPADPVGSARKSDGLDGSLHWVLVLVGAGVALGSVLFA